MKLNRYIVATLVAIFGIAFAGSILISSRNDTQLPDPDYTAKAHAVPLDFADESVRGALAFDSIFNNAGLDPLRGNCDVTKELYRIVIFPGFGGGDHVTMDMVVSGNTARAIERKWGSDPSHPHQSDWHIVSSKPIDKNEADAVRDEASRLLLSGVPVSNGFAPPDTAVWSVETCWHGRYHFFQRVAPEYVIPRDEQFLAFAHRLLALDKGLRAM